MTRVFERMVDIPADIAARIEAADHWEVNADNDLCVYLPLGGDDNIYFADRGVRQHIDHNECGLITLGLILVNTGEHRLKTQDGLFDLPVGSVYRLDAAKMHGTVTRKRSGFLCFVAHDIRLEDEPSPEAFAKEALSSAQRQIP